ncbi:unnamed protein product [Polarella glacialis]|uniref:Uncharacterized protein n=1 Tax=Polarella glacialis TaxID=89957 RepID=A0A813E3H6_POLGL|nr:unnamed protein product [Polarella glacialis]
MTDVVFNAFSELDSLLQAAQARSYRRRSQSAQAVLLRQPFETKTSVSEWLHEHGKCKPCAYQGLCRRGKGCLFCHSCDAGSLRAIGRANGRMKKRKFKTPVPPMCLIQDSPVVGKLVLL